MPDFDTTEKVTAATEDDNWELQIIKVTSTINDFLITNNFEKQSKTYTQNKTLKRSEVILLLIFNILLLLR